MPDLVVITCPDCGARRSYSLDLSDREDRDELRANVLDHIESHDYTSVDAKNLLIEALRTRTERTGSADEVAAAERAGWRGSRPNAEAGQRAEDP